MAVVRRHTEVMECLVCGGESLLTVDLDLDISMERGTAVAVVTPKLVSVEPGCVHAEEDVDGLQLQRQEEGL